MPVRVVLVGHSQGGIVIAQTAEQRPARVEKLVYPAAFCPIRDQHASFRRILAEDEPEPSDENAGAALLDRQYHEGLVAYDREVARRDDPVWERDDMQSAVGGRGV